MAGMDWFDIAKLAIPSLVVVIGWKVVYGLQRKAAGHQETRKDLRARIDRLETKLQSLCEKCSEYYVDTSKGSETAIPIKLAVEDIRRQTQIVLDHFFTTKNRQRTLDIVIDLTNAATGGSFESRSRKPLGAYDPQLTNLFNKASELINQFEGYFLEQYPPIRP